MKKNHCAATKVLRIAYDYTRGAVMTPDEEWILSCFDRIEIYKLANHYDRYLEINGASSSK